MRDTGCRAPWWARLCSPAIQGTRRCAGLMLRAAAIAFSSRLSGLARTTKWRESAPLLLPPRGGAAWPCPRRVPHSPSLPSPVPAAQGEPCSACSTSHHPSVPRHRPTSHLQRRSCTAAMSPRGTVTSPALRERASSARDGRALSRGTMGAVVPRASTPARPQLG